MKEIEDKLNISPNSINMHDGCLLAMKFEKDNLILKFMLEEYTLDVNSNVLEPYADKYMVLYEKFEGITINSFDFDSSFDFCCAEILGNEYDGKVFKLSLLDDARNFAYISFSFTSFKWKFDKFIDDKFIDEVYRVAAKDENFNDVFEINDEL
ncbi:MAG: hypothetical protein ACI35W_00720 [Anaeroplasmataceae bacterium]